MKKNLTGKDICTEIDRNVEEIKNLICKVNFLKTINVCWEEEIPFSKKELFTNMANFKKLVSYKNKNEYPTYPKTYNIDDLFNDFLKFVNNRKGYDDIVTKELIEDYIRNKKRAGTAQSW